MRNRDEECLKWALRAALFPCGAGKNPQRPGSYPAADGINYTGIYFPKPVKQIDKLKAQNINLAKCFWLGKRLCDCAQAEQKRSKCAAYKPDVD